MKFLRRLKHSIESLIYWFPVVWNDRDWDQYFLWRLLQRKFEKMNKYFEEDTIAVFETEDEIESLKALKELQQISKNLAEDAWDTYDPFPQNIPYEEKVALAEAAYKKLVDRLSFLLSKYSRYWWD